MNVNIEKKRAFNTDPEILVRIVLSAFLLHFPFVSVSALLSLVIVCVFRPNSSHIDTVGVAGLLGQRAQPGCCVCAERDPCQEGRGPHSAAQGGPR